MQYPKRNYDEPIHVPEGLLQRVKKAKDAYYKATGRKILNQDLAELLKISEIKLNNLECASDIKSFQSLSEYIDIGEGEFIPRSATIEDDTFLNPADKVELKEELQIKLAKTKDKRKIEVLNEQLARLEFETNSF